MSVNIEHGESKETDLFCPSFRSESCECFDLVNIYTNSNIVTGNRQQVRKICPILGEHSNSYILFSIPILTFDYTLIPTMHNGKFLSMSHLFEEKIQ